MWTINGVKERGRNAFRANYWNCVLVALIMGILLGVFTGTAGTAGKRPQKPETMPSQSPDYQSNVRFQISPSGRGRSAQR